MKLTVSFVVVANFYRHKSLSICTGCNSHLANFLRLLLIVNEAEPWVNTQKSAQMATFKFTLGFLLLLAVFVSICHAWRDKRVDQSWKNEYKLWRKRDTIPMADWLDGIPPVKKAMPFPEWNELNIPEKREMFEQCITKEAVGLSKRVKDYRSPDLLEVKEVCVPLYLAITICT